MNHDRPGGRVAPDGGTPFVTECGPDESTLHAMVRSIAAIRGVDETEIGPMYGRIEVEALEAMLEHADEHDCDVSVGFAIDGYTVFVRSDGEIQIVEDPLRTIPLDAE